jgi:uncharacterized ion transporter superfamily protein YfcC
MHAPQARATPDVALILLALAALLAGLAHLMPAGQFLVEMVNGKPRPVAGSYHVVAGWTGPPLFGSGDTVGLLNLLFEGLVSGGRHGSAVGVIAFLLVIGGAFGLVMQTGAIQRGLEALIRRGSARLHLLLPLLFVLFSLGGAVFGMGEEAVAFCLLLAPLLVRLGYDSLCAVIVTYVATQIGFATSWMNPFSVAVAQGISGVPVGSGAGLRMGMWAVFTAFGIAYLMHYAARVKADPTRSLTRAADLRHFPAPPPHSADAGAQLDGTGQARSTLAHADMAVLAVVAAGMVWVSWGVLAWGWYIPEIASQFFAMGLACALLAWLARLPGCDANSLAAAFRRGMADMLPAVLVVALAKGLVLLLGGDNPGRPSVLNTLLFHMGQGLDGLPQAVAAWGMLVLQSMLNFFVPSGSGQAALVMPLLAPLSDLLGLSRQVAVLAFQLGDGLTNIIIPTSASLVACLGAARIDWAVWLRFVWRLQLWLFALASVFVLAAVAVGYR